MKGTSKHSPEVHDEDPPTPSKEVSASLEIGVLRLQIRPNSYLLVLFQMLELNRMTFIGMGQLVSQTLSSRRERVPQNNRLDDNHSISTLMDMGLLPLTRDVSNLVGEALLLQQNKQAIKESYFHSDQIRASVQCIGECSITEPQ